MATASSAIKIFSRYLWLTLAMFALVALSFVVYVRAEKKTNEANELRERSTVLIAELRQSSDDLSRMARAYVATGDILYKRHYEEILEIRDGSRPRPTDYANVYWDLVLADDKRPGPMGNADALLNRLSEAQFPQAELDTLGASKADSDALTAIEQQAMAMVEDRDGGGDTRRLEAMRLLYGDNYHQAKARIMAPLHEVTAMADQRTQAAVRDAETRATWARCVLIVCGLLLALMVWSVKRSLDAVLGASVPDLYEHIKQLGSGDFSGLAAKIAPGEKGTVLAWLAEAQTRLAGIDAERAAKEEMIRNLAFYDSLTQLPNRRMLIDRFAHSTATSKRSQRYGAMIFIDLDDFKPLNDTHGHVAGDLLLIEVARRLVACVREMDTVARLGGDEFVVLVSELDADRSAAIGKVSSAAGKILQALASDYRLALPVPGQAAQVILHHCTASIGVALYVGQRAGFDEVLERADAAMYRAKKDGREPICFDER